MTTAETSNTIASTLPPWGDKWEDTKSYGSSVNLNWGSADDDDGWNNNNNSWTKKSSKGSPASAPAHSPERKKIASSPKLGASGGTDGPFPALLSISPKSASGGPGPDTGDAGATLSGQLDPFELPPTNNHIPNSEGTGGKGGKKEGRYSKGDKGEGKGKGRKGYKGSGLHEKPPVVHHYPPTQLMRNVGHPVNGGTTLLIAYFPWEASEEDVEREFTRYCNVKRVHLVMDKDKDRPRCFGFVKFENKEHAEAGLKAAVEGRVCLTDSRGHIWHLKAEWAKSGDMIDDNGFYRSEEGKGTGKGKGNDEDRWGSGSWGEDRWGSGSWGKEASTRSSSKGWGKDKENSFGSGSSWGKGRESYGKDSWAKGWDEGGKDKGKRDSWGKDNWESSKGKKGKDSKKGSWDESNKGRRSSWDDGTSKGKSSSWEEPSKGKGSWSTDRGSASSPWDDAKGKGKSSSKSKGGKGSSFFDGSKGGSFFESSPIDDFELEQSGFVESEGGKAAALEAAQKAATQLQLMQEVGRASQQMPEGMAVLFQQQAANNINAQYQGGNGGTMDGAQMGSNNGGSMDGNNNSMNGNNSSSSHVRGGSQGYAGSFYQYGNMSAVPEFTPMIDTHGNTLLIAESGNSGNSSINNGTMQFNMDGLDGNNMNNNSNNMSAHNSSSMSSMSNNNSNNNMNNGSNGMNNGNNNMSNNNNNNNAFTPMTDGSNLNGLFGGNNGNNGMTPMSNGGNNNQQHQIVLSEASLSQLPNNMPNNTGIIIPAGLAKMLLAHLQIEGSPTTVVVNGAPSMNNGDGQQPKKHSEQQYW